MSYLTVGLILILALFAIRFFIVLGMFFDTFATVDWKMGKITTALMTGLFLEGMLIGLFCVQKI